MPDRAVLAAQPRLIVPDRLAASQPFENVLDRRVVDVKLSYVPPDVLVGFIPEQLQLGAVRLQDRPVRTHPVQAHRAVLEEVEEIVELRQRGAALIAYEQFR